MATTAFHGAQADVRRECSARLEPRLCRPPEETTDTSMLASVWRVSFVITTSLLQMRRGRDVSFGSKRIFPPSLKQKQRDLSLAEQVVTFFFPDLKAWRLQGGPRRGIVKV